MTKKKKYVYRASARFGTRGEGGSGWKGEGEGGLTKVSISTDLDIISLALSHLQWKSRLVSCNPWIP